MQPVPLFSSLIVSRPRSRAHILRRARGLALATTLCAAGLACLLVAPLLMIEMVQAPKAAGFPIIFEPRAREGDNRPAGTVRRGELNGSEHAAQARNEHPAQARRPARPVVGPIAPPESEVQERSTESPGTDDAGNGHPNGNPLGNGKRPTGPLTGCADCPGTGPGDQNGVEEIYNPGTSGLAPPQLV